MQTTSPSSTVAPSAQPGWQPAALAQAIHLRSQMNGSISWFFIIAGMTVVNSVLFRSGAQLTFVVGLAASQFVDGISVGLAAEFDAGPATVITGIGLVVSLGLAGVFVLAGWLARRQHRWAVVAGMVLYALDSLILLVFADWLGLIFHALALVGLFRAIKAIGDLRRLEAALATGDARALETLVLDGGVVPVPMAPEPMAVPHLLEPVSAKATVSSVLLEPLHWMLILPFSLLGLFMAFLAVYAFSPALVLVTILCLIPSALLVWVALTRRLEVSNEGVRYWEGPRKLFFPWAEMSAAKMERPVKQITFWMGGKLRRIHEFGLPQEELKRVREVLVQQITARRIPVR